MTASCKDCIVSSICIKACDIYDIKTAPLDTKKEQLRAINYTSEHIGTGFYIRPDIFISPLGITFYDSKLWTKKIVTKPDLI